MARPDLVVVGDCNPDVVVSGDAEPAFGQVEKLVDAVTLTIGGSAAITAAGAARLGVRTALVSVVGDDAFGRLQLDALRARGVDVAAVRVDPERPTGVTVVLARGPDRAMLTAPGTIPALRGELVHRDLLRAARHVHVSSYFLQPQLRRDLPGLLADARSGGTTVSLDTNWDPAGTWDDGLRRLLPDVDVFLPNAAEARLVAGVDDLDEAVEALSRLVDVVVVKLGEEGALLRAGGRTVRHPAAAVTAVDTTGAGDSFAAGFLAGRLRGWPDERALALAVACGSLSTRATGGVDGQPDLEEAAALVGNAPRA